MTIEPRFVRLGNCSIDDTALICLGAIVGKPFRPLLEPTDDPAPGTTAIGANAYVGYYAIVGAGSTIARGAIVDDSCQVESDVIVGERTLIIYRAQICNEARVGRGCVIGGFVAERVVIGDGVRMFGRVVHSQLDPTLPWDAPRAAEASAVIEDGAFVGFDALVIGGIVVGPNAYVCAGAMITRNVPDRHVAYGVNKIVPASEWKGPLNRSSQFVR